MASPCFTTVRIMMSIIAVVSKHPKQHARSDIKIF
jgi:hypothetical protein